MEEFEVDGRTAVGYLAVPQRGHGSGVLVLHARNTVRHAMAHGSEGPWLTLVALSSWLYHFAQVGTSVMVIATSLVASGTGVLPRWLALLGFLLALVALLHFQFPLIGTLANLVWVALVSALMLVGLGSASTPRRLAR